MAEYFSSNLKYLREQKKLSQNKLGKMVGVNQTTIARWEDDNRVPTINNAIDVSKALNVSLPDLLGKDLRISDNINEETNEAKKIEMLKQVLKDKGFLNESEEMTEEDFNKLIEFAKANKQFIMNDKK